MENILFKKTIRLYCKEKIVEKNIFIIANYLCLNVFVDDKNIYHLFIIVRITSTHFLKKYFSNYYFFAKQMHKMHFACPFKMSEQIFPTLETVEIILKTLYIKNTWKIPYKKKKEYLEDLAEGKRFSNGSLTSTIIRSRELWRFRRAVPHR